MFIIISYSAGCGDRVRCHESREFYTPVEMGPRHFHGEFDFCASEDLIASREFANITHTHRHTQALHSTS